MKKAKSPKQYPIKTRGLGQSPKPPAGKKTASQLRWDAFYEAWPKVIEENEKNQLEGAVEKSTNLP